MIRPIPVLSLALAAALAAAGAAAAQNLVVSNARIITGTGQVIDRGSVVVRGGKIASVGPGAAPAPAHGTVAIDGTGMTVMAGYIDDHRHLVYGPPDAYFKDQAADRMRELLEAGFTTVQSGGDNGPAILELRRKVESGELKGPRILASAQVPTGRLKDEAEVRAAVRAAKASGADSIAEVIYPGKSFPAEPTEQEAKNLSAGIDEATKLGLPLQVHAVSPMAMLAAVRAGAKKLVHTPHFGWLTDADAKAVKDAGALVSSCTGFGAPVFGVFNQDNRPTFRDGKPWPDAILDGQGRGREAGYKPVNGRTLFDNGVDYGFCTDTNYNATAALAQELKVLNLVFSPIDLVKIMGRNSADFIDKTDRGTLEPGKLGDMVVLAGNPLDGYWNLLSPKVVIKGGAVMVDKRAPARPVRR
jgi:imidazolonepropionase-like amidohydrolase